MELTERGRTVQRNRLDVTAGDGARHRTHWKLEKRNCSIEDFVEERLPADLKLFRQLGAVGADEMEAVRLAKQLRSKTDELARAFHFEVKPVEVIDFEGNILVTVGIDLMLDLLVGGGGTVMSNANAYLGVGDSSTAAAVGQTDLQAASNKLRKAMTGGYPAVASPKVTFQSTFGSSEANFTWNEVGTFNAASAGIMLNRKVQALGTKSSGATWTLTEDITFS